MTNNEIARQWFAAIDKQDFGTIRDLMHADHKFQNPMTPEPIEVEGHLGMMTLMTKAFDGHHNLELLLEDGNYAVVRGNWSGKHIGEFNGIPATGKTVNFTFIDIFEIIEGRVRTESFEMNPMAIMSQIGAAPAL
jgi:predicted ester cyclase